MKGSRGTIAIQILLALLVVLAIGKLDLWHALSELALGDGRLDPAKFDRLIARAELQLERLAEHHRRAVDDAFHAPS